MIQTSENRISPVVPVKKSIEVSAPLDVAFRVFTAEMSTWWDLANYRIGSSEAVAAVIEPKQGGRWFERGADGSECDWGKVIAWEPPSRVVLAWQISANWQFDPKIQSEVEVRFQSLSSSLTRVDLEHRLLDTYGDRGLEMHGIFDSAQGWSLLLSSYSSVGGKAASS